ncbi:MAG: NAD(P)-dependent alcohol dehydrogenase [Crocinitomicaceae bacterium]|nr:NAD(P)-dependent alcohol dehydrogenase [Crocinitomicaceae bacterium]
MKAIFATKYGGPEVLQQKEIEIPVPKPNEVRIKTHTTTVTVADVRVRSFNVPASFWIPARFALGIFKPRKPILGVEISGEIDEVGNAVTKFKKGDLVFASTFPEFGGYAEYKCISENGALALKPKNISLEESAAIPIGGYTALNFLRKSELKAGQKILIYGASGSVGSYAVQIARHFGANITAVCSAKNVELVKSLGADKVLDYTAPDFNSQLEIYDVILVAVDKFPFSLCKKILAKNGTYLNVSLPVKSLNMMWTSLTTSQKIYSGKNDPVTSADLNYLKDLVEAGSLKVVVDKVYSFDQMVEAHHYVDQGHKKGNVLVRVS